MLSAWVVRRSCVSSVWMWLLEVVALKRVRCSQERGHLRGPPRQAAYLPFASIPV